jgi:hypothetical protein
VQFAFFRSKRIHTFLPTYSLFEPIKYPWICMVCAEDRFVSEPVPMALACVWEQIVAKMFVCFAFKYKVNY